LRDDGQRVRMLRLTQVHGSFAARVMLARLADEGIDARLRGAVDSPYRFTVGEMARVEVYVPEDQMADAAYVLLANEVEDATLLPEPHTSTWTGQRWIAAVVLLAVVLMAVAPVAHLVRA
jgi:hypothetical protein